MVHCTNNHDKAIEITSIISYHSIISLYQNKRIWKYFSLSSLLSRLTELNCLDIGLVIDPTLLTLAWQILSSYLWLIRADHIYIAPSWGAWVFHGHYGHFNPFLNLKVTPTILFRGALQKHYFWKLKL